MRFISFIAIIALTLLASACSSGPPAPPPTPTNGPSIGQLASAGQAVFANRCARCHGANGQGVTAPPVIGASANLGKYNTAQGLYAFISTVMPLDAPGALSQAEYQQLLCLLLVQNNFATANTPFDQTKLGNIPLK
ncbi:MAG: c-type cytochrome [Chloroflexota bacterium]|nr:c-type cytochrome [Chloroflexota bacterium]